MRPPVRVLAVGERKALAVVPTSMVQALRLADEYAEQLPGRELLVKRGEEVLYRIEPDRADPDHEEAA